MDNLLTHNREVADCADENGYTPAIVIAAKKNNMSMMHLVLPHSAIAWQDNYGKMVLHLAIIGVDIRREDKDFLDALCKIVSYARQGHKRT